MVVLLKKKKVRQYIVRSRNRLKALQRSYEKIAFCGNREGLNEICKNLNDDVPQIKLSKITKSQKLCEVYKGRPIINQTAIMETTRSTFVPQEMTTGNHNAGDENGNRETIARVEICDSQLPTSSNCSMAISNLKPSGCAEVKLMPSGSVKDSNTNTKKVHEVDEKTTVVPLNEFPPDLREQPNVINEIRQNEIISRQDINASTDLMSDVSNPLLTEKLDSPAVETASSGDHVNRGKTTIPLQTVPEPKDDENHKNFFLESLKLVASHSSTTLHDNFDLIKLSLDAIAETNIRTLDGIEATNPDAPLIIFDAPDVGLPLDVAVIEIISNNSDDQTGNSESTIEKTCVASMQCLTHTNDLRERQNIPNNTEELQHSPLPLSDAGDYRPPKQDNTDHPRDVDGGADSENDPRLLIRKDLSEELNSPGNADAVSPSQALNNSKGLHNASFFASRSEDNQPVDEEGEECFGSGLCSSSLNNPREQLNKSSDSKVVQYSQLPASKAYSSPHQDDTDSSGEAAENDLTENVCLSSANKLSGQINTPQNAEVLQHSPLPLSDAGDYRPPEQDITDQSRDVAGEAGSENDPRLLMRKDLSEELNSPDNFDVVSPSQALNNSRSLHDVSFFASRSEDNQPVDEEGEECFGSGLCSSSLNNSREQLNKSSDSEVVQHFQLPASKAYSSPHQDDTDCFGEVAENDLTENICLSSANKLSGQMNTSQNAECWSAASNLPNPGGSKCSLSPQSGNTDFLRTSSEKMKTTENKCTQKPSQKLDYSYDLTFFNSIDDEWLPDDVQYEMTPLLEKLLDDNNTEIGIGEGSVPERDTVREYDKNMTVLLSPNPSRKSQIKEKEAHSPAICIPSSSCHDFSDQPEESDNDSGDDRTYAPSDDSENSMSDNNISNNSARSRRASSSKSNNNSLNDSRLLNISDKAATGSLDNTNLIVQTSDEKQTEKKYFCKYCKKLYHKLARHLESVHKDEPDVQKFAVLPKGNEERKKIISILRKTGTFEFNTNPKYNSGVLLTSRRPHRKYNKKASDYITCIKCLGSFSISNIRHHIAVCDKSRKKSERSILVLGRTVEGRLHKDASDKLRLEVFPPLKEDDVVRIVRYDRLLIIWGNKLCIRYAPHYQHNMVRSRLRYAGRLLLAAKTINPDIEDFASLYTPKRYDDVVKAVRAIANFDAVRGEFKVPAVAMNLGTYLRQIGEILINEYVKAENAEGERNVERFLKIFKVDYATDVNKVALDSQRKQQREREVVLPSIEDIKKFINYLEKEMKESCRKLATETFSYEEWLKLAQLTMALLITFNRKRVGDIQNIEISRYEARRRIDASTDEAIYKSLTPASKAIANKSARMTIRGKKGRTVPLLLFPQLEKSIDLILENRKNAGVPGTNEYVFGLPSYNNKRIKVVDGCTAMREFSKKSGANFPETLRGTELRKHIATHCVALNISDNETAHLAEYLGHDEPIHRKTYRQHIESRDVFGISRLLEAAQGKNDFSDESDIENPEGVLEPTVDNVQSNTNVDFNDTEFDNSRLSTMPRDGSNVMPDDELSLSNVPISNGHPGTSIQATGMIAEKRGARKKKKTKSMKAKVTTDEENATQKKRLWSREEKNLILKEFSKHMSEKRLPSFAEISQLKSKHPGTLGNRTLPQIKTWIHNQYKSNNKR